MNILNTKTDIFDKDVITLNNKKFKVYMYENVHKYNNFNPYPFKKYYRRKTRVPNIVFNDYQYIGELENLNLPSAYYLYGKIIDYHRKLFNYLILKKKKNKKLIVISKLKYKSKLELGDLINIRIENSLYTPFTIVP